ncbi:MAG: nucleotide sugar dehydrogenase [Nitrospiraceae bacterium]|nr:MAG: nucleotide sugar dehydrogenase [Nitrospiraceae bacterium]
MNIEYSVSPGGEKFPLPKPEEYKNEFDRLKEEAAKQRKLGREVVVVMGVGFVGVAMAAVIADAVNRKGRPGKYVIGMQRPSPRSYWKIPILNKGISPVVSEDRELGPMISRCVLDKKTLTATFVYEALSLADVVVVDIQCDYHKESLGNVRNGHADMSPLEESLAVIAEHIAPDTLVLIETTVAPGTTEQIAYPIMKKVFQRRRIKKDPLLAHSFERVMPGKNYVASIRDFWRVCSGINQQAKDKVVKFLGEIINIKDYPLTVLDKPIESETAKIIENSFRATTLAFLDEWSLFAERNGVDLLKVINAIKARPTHSNIIFPGPGIGGYCLPKDGGLGVWAYRHIHGFEDDIFKITPLAININDTRSLHVAQLTRDALRNMSRPIAAADIVLLGASYREDVGDTRYSGSELVVRRLTEMGAEMRAHDPYLSHWWEFENQENYPKKGQSLARFFRNQDKLSNLKMETSLEEALKGADAIIFAVRHKQYLNLDPDKVVKKAGNTLAVIDCFGILDDKKIRRYFELGCEVKGLGRGHIRRIKDEVRTQKPGKRRKT